MLRKYVSTHLAHGRENLVRESDDRRATTQPIDADDDEVRCRYADNCINIKYNHHHPTMLRSTMSSTALLLRGGNIACRHMITHAPSSSLLVSSSSSYSNDHHFQMRRNGGRMMSNGSYGESIPDEYIEELDETEGEWIGCSKKFLAPISVSSRGSGTFNVTDDRYS